MKYELLALDLDGTLLTSDKKISDRTAEALADLISRGGNVTLSTGRGLYEIAEYRDTFSSIGIQYGIMNSGALVYDFQKEKVISQKTMDRKDVELLIDQCRKEMAMTHLLTRNASVVSEEQRRDMSIYQMGIYQPMFDMICCNVDSLTGYMDRHPEDDVLKVCMYHRTAESRERTREELKGMDLTFAFAERTSLEASPPGTSKGSGLKDLCAYLDIPIEKTVAVGDADNDIAILNTAGLAVAMGNAPANIKEMCGMVVADNDQDGVAEVISRVSFF